MLVAYGGLAATLVAGNSPELGLDLQGGVSVVLAPTGDATGDQLDQAIEIIRNRVDALGVAEPEITRQGNTIVVQLPGVKNRDRALELVGQTAELRFRPVLQEPDRAGREAAEPRRPPTPGRAPRPRRPRPRPATTTDHDGTATTATSEGRCGPGRGRERRRRAGADDHRPRRHGARPPRPPTRRHHGTDGAGPQAPTEGPCRSTSPATSDEADADGRSCRGHGRHRAVYQLGPTLATGRIVEDGVGRHPERAVEGRASR